MKKLSIIILSLIIYTQSFAQEIKSHQFYSEKGNPVDFTQLISELKKYDVVFIGEYHNSSINHWLQLKITEALIKNAKGEVVLGAEMFERDNQAGLTQYVEGIIEEEKFREQVRLWKNYETDYKPLVETAKENKLKFIATNVPRRYASIVAKKGIDSLNTVTEEEKEWISRLPVKFDMKTPGYQEMIEMMGDHAGPNAENFVKAQAIKDATMAESIFNNLPKGGIFIHYNGNYHSKEYGGTVWYLKQFSEKIKIAVISVEESENSELPFPAGENYIPTQYTLVIPADMTKTY